MAPADGAPEFRMMKVAWVRGEREYSAHQTLDKALTDCQLSSGSVVSLMRFLS